MSLITASHNPPLTASADISVLDAANLMMTKNVGAVAIVEDGLPIGMFTDRDVLRVISEKMGPETVLLRDVMSKPCMTIPSDRTINDAVALMKSRDQRHVGVVDEHGKLVGIVSYRTLLGQIIESLNAEVDHLSAYMGDDGIGGD